MLSQLMLSLEMARSHGPVVKADGSWPRGCEFKPQHRILDGCKQLLAMTLKKNWKLR